MSISQTTDPDPASAAPMEPTPIKVDVWSDIACPWCYIGKRKFETALADTGIPVEIEYHAYELAPDLPEEFEGSEQDYLKIRGYSADQVQDVRADEMHAQELGIRGVPYYVFDDTYGVSGAQDPATLSDILRQLAAQKEVS